MLHDPNINIGAESEFKYAPNRKTKVDDFVAIPTLPNTVTLHSDLAFKHGNNIPVERVTPEAQLNRAMAFINGSLNNIDGRIKIAQEEVGQHDRNYGSRPVTDQYFDWRFEQNEKYYGPKRKALEGRVALLNEQRSDLIETFKLLHNAQTLCLKATDLKTKNEILNSLEKRATNLLNKKYDDSLIKRYEREAELGRAEIYNKEGTILTDCVAAGVTLGGLGALAIFRGGAQAALSTSLTHSERTSVMEFADIKVPQTKASLGSRFAKMFSGITNTETPSQTSTPKHD